MLRTYFNSMLSKVLQHFWFNNLTLQLPWFNLNLQFSSEVIHSNVQFVYLKVEKVIMRNADRVILTKSIHNIYVGLVKHMNIISLKGWILATVINFNRQIQGLLFSFDCQPPALHWLRQQFHVVFCIFCSSSVFFQGIKFDVVFLWQAEEHSVKKVFACTRQLLWEKLKESRYDEFDI